jgi:hypothetical protein
MPVRCRLAAPSRGIKLASSLLLTKNSGMAGPLQSLSGSSDLILMRIRAEQFVKPQYQFETGGYKYGKNHPERLAKRLAQHEARRQNELAASRREAGQLQAMIANLKREIVNLDDSIASELAMSRVREPSHFAYPISVTMMQARRANLQHTVAALTDRLSGVRRAAAEPGGSTRADALLHPHMATRFDVSQE